MSLAKLPLWRPLEALEQHVPRREPGPREGCGGAQPRRSAPLRSMPNAAFVSPEYAENIGDGRSPEFRENEQKRILGLLENF